MRTTVKRSVAKTLSTTMAVAVTAGSMQGAGLFTPEVALADNAGTADSNITVSNEKITLTDSQIENYLEAVNESTVSVHDPSVVVGEDSQGQKCYYIFGSHMAWAKSYDLETWKTFRNNINTDYRTIFAEAAEWSAKGSSTYDVSGNLWAPDVIYNEELGKWCMYMSVNGDKWYSSIVMLTADNLEGDWTLVDTVVYSGFTNASEAALTDYTEVTGSEFDDAAKTRYTQNRNGNRTYSMNCIDPCVFYDEDGKLWMTYGSWFGGIYMIELDASTGLRDLTHTYELADNASDPYQGIKLAGGQQCSGEASYVQYINGYYYLFITNGGLTANGGYNMRVFRSENVTGPYTDLNGEDARYTAGTNNINNSIGTRLMGYYRFSWMQNAQVAQGHNSAFTDEDGNSYLVYHTRTNDGTEGHYVRVHQLFTTAGGALVAAPFEYKNTDNTEYTEADVAGMYEMIIHKGTDYANLECNEGIYISLDGNGKITGDKTGTYTVDAANNVVKLTIDGTTYEGVMVNQTLEGTTTKSLCFTAVSNTDLCIWGAKMTDGMLVSNTGVALNQQMSQVVSKDLELPTTMNGTKITWASSNTAILGNDGKFTAPAEDTEVELTATVSMGEYQYIKTYKMTAKALMDGTEDRYVAAKYFTDSAFDLSTGATKTVANPFNESITGVDISNGVAIKFDVELKSTTVSPLATIFGFGGNGKLYFTGASYLGYNAGGKYFDANINNWATLTDYIGTYNKATVEIQFTKDGFAVYVDDKLAYDNTSVDSKATGFGGDITDYSMVLDYLANDATTFNFGTGSWWDEAFKGEISNVEFYINAVNNMPKEATGALYATDYTDGNIKEWVSANASGALTVAKDDEHGKYFKFANGSDSGNRTAVLAFNYDENEDASLLEGNYTVSFDAQMTAGTVAKRSVSSIALFTTDAAKYNANAELTSGYILKLTNNYSGGQAANKWTINGTDEVTIAANAWVNIKVQVDAQAKTAAVVITGEDGSEIYNGTVAINGTGTLKGLQLLRGRGIGTFGIDNIFVGQESSDTETIVTEVQVDKTESTSYGQKIDGSAGWNTSAGDNYTLSGDFDSTITMNVDAFVRDNDNWSNFVMETVAENGVKGITLRADAFGWTYGDGSDVTYTAALSEGFWDKFHDISEGLVYVNAKKTSDTTMEITVTYANDDTAKLTYVVTYADGVPSELKFHVGADGAVTNVLKYVDNVTGESTEYGQVIDGSTGWNTSAGDNYTLKGDFDANLAFDVAPFIRDTSNWSNFIIETVAENGTKGITLRADAYGWTYGDGSDVTYEATVSEGFWDKYQTISKGLTLLNVKKTSDTTVEMTVTYASDDTAKLTYKLTYANGVPSELRFHMGADGGKIAVWSYENDYTVTEKKTEVVAAKKSAASVEVATAFATVNVGYTDVTATYTVKNTGTETLTNVKATLKDAVNFEIVEGLADTLEAGETMTVVVKAKNGLAARALAYADVLTVSAEEIEDIKTRVSLSVVEAATEGAKNENPNKPDDSLEDVFDDLEDEDKDEDTEDNTDDTVDTEDTEDADNDTEADVKPGDTPSSTPDADKQVVSVETTTKTYTKQETVTETVKEPVVNTETFTGYGWWDANNKNSSDVELIGEGKVEIKLTVADDGAGADFYAAFNLEAVDDQGHYITTGSDLNAWYFDATGNDISGIASTFASTIKPGTYTLTVTRSGNSFAFTYLNPDGSRYARFIAGNTNLGQNVKVHIIPQVGGFTMSTTTYKTVTKTSTVDVVYTVTTVTTKYSDGSMMMVATTTNPQGKVVSIVTTNIDKDGNVTVVEDNTPQANPGDTQTSESGSTDNGAISMGNTVGNNTNDNVAADVEDTADEEAAEDGEDVADNTDDESDKSEDAKDPEDSEDSVDVVEEDAPLQVINADKKSSNLPVILGTIAGVLAAACAGTGAFMLRKKKSSKIEK